MHLKLVELQKLVQKTIDSEVASQALKEEIARVLGPSVITEGTLVEVVAAANDRMDVLDRTGRSNRMDWQPTVISVWMDHDHPEVRKFAARVVPHQFLVKMSKDKNSDVRGAVASRLPLNSIREMIKRFPQDDGLRSILKQKKLHEAGLPKPEVQPLGHDPVEGAERLGDVVKTAQGPELSEAWYHQRAMKFLHDYGRNIEYAWEELAVSRFCRSVKSTTGVEVDESKLLKNIKKLIKEKEDNFMERNALKETLAWLENQTEKQDLHEGLLPDVVEAVDPVYELVEGNLTGEQFIERASKLFNVQESMLPLGIRKYRLGEGNARQTMVPVIGMLPHNNGFRAVDERALDTFCEQWTRKQQLVGEPLRLEWTTHPSNMNKIGFTCVLK